VCACGGRGARERGGENARGAFWCRRSLRKRARALPRFSITQHTSALHSSPRCSLAPPAPAARQRRMRCVSGGVRRRPPSILHFLPRKAGINREDSVLFDTHTAVARHSGGIGGSAPRHA
jgi:hypothetical protein